MYSSYEKFDQIGFLLDVLLKCPICNHKYKKQSAKVVEYFENDSPHEKSATVHGDCSNCKASVIFSVEVCNDEIYSVGIVTDLTAADYKKFSSMPEISADDCVLLHQALEEKRLDFKAIFKILPQ